MWITSNDSSVSAVQFMAEKSEFKWLARTDRKCFCSATSNFAPDK